MRRSVRVWRIKTGRRQLPRDVAAGSIWGRQETIWLRRLGLQCIVWEECSIWHATSQIPNARDRDILVQTFDGIPLPSLCDSGEVMAGRGEVVAQKLVPPVSLPWPPESCDKRGWTGTEG